MNQPTLENKLRDRSAIVATIGIGYAGLPMAIELARAGFRVVGHDVDHTRVKQINRGLSPVSNVGHDEIAQLRDANRLVASSDSAVLEVADVAIICVPTPLAADGGPDLRFVTSAGNTIADHLHSNMLVVLQSTCSPGTTVRQLLPQLESVSGLRGGRDFFLVFAPERIDPGNPRYTVKNTPKLIGGITEESTRLGCLLYESCIDEVVPVSSPEVAELAKLVENTFRFINISFINEVALLCDRLGVNVWQVIEAAKTKPFAFLPHYPSPGVGGHCIPVVPRFLAAAAREHGSQATLIDAAVQINEVMPRLVVEKLEQALEVEGKELLLSRVLVVGITYKPDIADIRETAALRVIDELLARGVEVAYHDPLIPSLRLADDLVLHSQPLSPDLLSQQDAVLLLTPHTTLDYTRVVQHAPLVIDTHSGLHPRVATNVRNIWVPSQVPNGDAMAAPESASERELVLAHG